MKRFFPELTSCFSATPAVHTIAADEAPTRRRRMAQGKSRKNWRPALAAIDEDVSVREARKANAQSGSGFKSEKKPLIRSKLAGKIRSDSYEFDHRGRKWNYKLDKFKLELGLR
ncbi:hypothetical protein M8C21_023739 [Ambrosia artemisiifolia]|uniref:Uncharacterized protein n=1 Tax=Ambrosia artemisiifolia TaxID=4212 RepID=A0AAD5C1H8_AMBAR|nr:hypothetical protein M8C21_023739 [Ambrosia artemisiifolia]